MMRFPTFEKARELDPRNSSVLWNLAETYACVGRYEEAERTFAEGLEVNPDAHLFSLAQRCDRLAKRKAKPRRCAPRCARFRRTSIRGARSRLSRSAPALMEGDYAEGSAPAGSFTLREV